MWVLTVVTILYKILYDFIASYFTKPLKIDDFTPPKYATLAYAQTFMIYILNEFTQKKYIATDVITTKDNEPIVLEWMSYPKQNKSPILILMHGIGGCSDSCYIRAWFKRAQESSYGILVLNRPGFHHKYPLPTNCTRYPTFSDPHILEYTVDFIVDKYPSNPIFIIGYSAGGLHTFKYASSEKKHENVKGVVGISVCYEMIHMLNYLKKTTWMNEFMGRLIMDMYRVNPHIFPLLQKGTNVISIIEDYLKYYLNSKESIENYLIKCSCHEDMLNLNIPALCIQSRDDMFFPTNIIEELLNKIKRQNSNITTMITQYGGHVSWVDENYDIWVIKSICDFMEQVY